MWRTRGAAALRPRGPFQGQRILRNGLCPQRQRLVRGRQLRKTQRRKNRSQDRNQKGGLNHGVQARSQDRSQVEKRKVSRQRSWAAGAQVSQDQPRAAGRRGPLYAAFFFGTFAPSCRALERPIAIACLRFFTLCFPDRM